MHQGTGTDLVPQGPSVADVATRPGGLSDAEKPMVFELAVAAMDELVRLAQSDEPLWIPGHDGAKETLNYDEYVRQFPRGIGPKPFGLKTEATRETGLVMMNGVTLVETLMDHVRPTSSSLFELFPGHSVLWCPKLISCSSCHLLSVQVRWTEMFPCMVSRALTVEVLSTGIGACNRNGALQLVSRLQRLHACMTYARAYFGIILTLTVILADVRRASGFISPCSHT